MEKSNNKLRVTGTSRRRKHSSTNDKISGLVAFLKCLHPVVDELIRLFEKTPLLLLAIYAVIEIFLKLFR